MSSENSRADTDNDSIECFQNYSASEVFIQGLAGLVDQQDVESMIRAQKQILQRFEKTNEMLSNCNTLSVSRLKIAGHQFKTYKQLLVDIKKDLDYTFKKINVLKSKLQTQYPESSSASIAKIDDVEEELKSFQEENISEQLPSTTESNCDKPNTSENKSEDSEVNKTDVSCSSSSELKQDDHTKSNSDTT